MFSNLVELILREIVKVDVEMRTGHIATGLKTRPLKKILKPFRNFGVLGNGGESREVCGCVLE